jgi:hypothetical protein
MKLHLAILLAVPLVGACGGGDTVEPPAELVVFDAVLEVREAWKQGR